MTSGTIKLGRSILVGCAISLTLTACGTTQVNRVASAAPIQYKTGMNTSYTAPSRVITPQTVRPTLTLPQSSPLTKIKPTVKAPIFDQSSIDTDLYAHQKVGRPYRINGKRYSPKHDPKYNKTGKASWYGPNFHGKPTATGETFDMTAMTAAHKTLPLNSMAYVTNLDTGESIMVRVNDRGPFVDGRIIDLSKAAATKLGVITHGTAKVRVQYAGPADPMAAGTQFKHAAPVTSPKLAKPASPITSPEPSLRPKPALKPVPMPETSSPQMTKENTSDLIANVDPSQGIEQGYKPLRRGAPIGLEALRPRSTPQSGIQTARKMPPMVSAPERSVPVAPMAPVQSNTPYTAPRTPLQAPAFPKRLPEDRMPSDDDVITLTIDGPIHMATDRNIVISAADPEFIPATYKKVIQ